MKSILETLDIRAKLLAFAAFMVWSLAFNHPMIQLGLFGIILLLCLGSGLAPGAMIKRLAPLAPLLILILAFTGFTPAERFIHGENQAVLYTLFNLDITRGGLMLGATFVLRLMNMVAASLLFLTLTPLDDFINLFVKLRLSRTLSFIITTAIRFVPELDRKRHLILTAQRARGMDPNGGNPLQKLKSRLAVMVPLMVNAILLADQLSLSLMNRGFGYENQWTPLSRLRARPRDFFLSTLAILGIFLGIFLGFTRTTGMI